MNLIEAYGKKITAEGEDEEDAIAEIQKVLEENL